jgi:hypothetical protein
MDDAPELTCERCGATIPLPTTEQGWASIRDAQELLNAHANCQRTARLGEAG